MSVILRTVRLATIQAAPRIAVPASRAFHATPPPCKSATQTVKDGLKTVDRAVSDKLVDGIDLATAAKDKVKDTAGKLTHHPMQKASGMAAETKGRASGMMNETKGKASGMMDEAKGKASGMMEETKEKAKERADKLREKAGDASEGMWDKF